MDFVELTDFRHSREPSGTKIQVAEIYERNHCFVMDSKFKEAAKKRNEFEEVYKRA